MKICIILPHFYPYIGGGEKLFYDMARGYVAAGHEVRVVARNVGEEYLGHKNMDGMDIYYCKWHSMFGHPLPLKEDMEQHVKWCDIVHTSTFTTSPLVSRLARKYHKPSIITIHEIRGKRWFWVESFPKAVLFFLYEQYTCRQKFDVYHAVSDATKRDILQYCGRKKDVRRVYNAVGEMDENLAADSTFDIYKYFNIPSDTRTFLYYGRPGKTKGVDIYRRALCLLKDRIKIPSDVKFCFLLGAEPVKLRKQFVKSIEKKGLSDFVIIKESLPRKDLCKCIQQADYVVVPSVTEGFGLSALEACLMNKKILSSDGGALPEVVYGQCIQFQNRNSEELCEHLQNVIVNGNQAFKCVAKKSFPYDTMITQMLEIYDQMLGKTKHE